MKEETLDYIYLTRFLLQNSPPKAPALAFILWKLKILKGIG